MTVDVELTGGSEWAAIGMLVVQYPSGKIIGQFETACDPLDQQMSAPRKKFWERHPEARDHISSLSSGKLRQTEERRVFAFVSKWIRLYPSLFLVSDNPSFDVHILQSILRRVRPTFDITVRKHGQYYQPVCIWSMKIALQMIGAYTPTKHEYIQSDTIVHIVHTPLYDCMCILNRYFDLLKCTQNIRSYAS